MKFSILTVLGITGFFALPSYAAVTITGLTEPLEKNARSLIHLASAPCDAAPWRVERLYQNMDKQLSDAMRALGHYQFEFHKTLTFDDSACWSATLDIAPGEPVLLRTVAVNVTGEARSDAALLTRIDARRPVPDTVLNHGQYETYKKFVMSMLRARGYFEAQLIENSVVVDESLSFADIQLQVSSGPRYVFGPIEFGELVLDRSLLFESLKPRF